MGSLSSSMYTAVSALRSQSSAVSTISNNLANSETVGFKTTDANFKTLVTGTSSQLNFTGAGVIANPSQNISQQGVLVGTENETDLAIDGSGFFIVARDSGSSDFAYTRVGNFSTDANGFLVNDNGFYLQGYPTNRDGKVTIPKTKYNLEAVNINSSNLAPVPTSKVTVEANLPSDAIDGASVQSNVEIFDSQGNAHTMLFTYTKSTSADNTWNVVATLADEGNPAAQPGTITDATWQVTFDGDGYLTSVTKNGTTIDSTSPTGTSTNSLDPIGITWNNGTTASSITYVTGEIGSANILSQYASTDGSADISIDKITQDGVKPGAFYSASVSETGLVYVNYDNGVSKPIYQIMLATFTNPDGLEAASGNVYTPTTLSGAETLNTPGSAATGSLSSGALESSNTDTATEFSKLITSQQAYSAATQILEAAQDMFQDLIQAKK
ncbi:flagellar hook protein FlgE [Pararhodospirillum photometricum]|uniref:Flagellar hook protein FlgE n=1 Tax=Pararhodospirillum photometricum DSM 122 TaxID=1150469 RepID=H6SN73_PARPM|nr:flagellar hook protein FlgE [Pararhodospirillum photometricum]CCG06949.1 Putative uncharacterized protein [Pararhodospirillum photometricum DSM 122]